MDIRTEIVQKITTALADMVNEDVVDLVADTLIIELNQYEVTERCTAVAVRDDSAEGMLRKFIATKRVEGLSEKTLNRYAEQNRELFTFIGKPLAEITAYDIRFYLSMRRQMGRVSNRSLDGMRRCYSSFFKWLTTEELIPKNPCLALARIKYRKEVKKPYSAAEMERMREACDNLRDLALLDFLYATGCRVSEVVGLNISDIDFDNRECVVLGKGDKERTVYLTEVAAMHLRQYIDARTDMEDALFVGVGRPSRMVASGIIALPLPIRKRARRVEKNAIEAIVKRIGERAGVKNAHPHRFRRTLATNLLDRGMPIQDVAAILGHADLKTTQVYCYISQANTKSTYRKYAA